jgi:hypothetical protein
VQQRDDLLTIDGIDPTTEMALNSIGIRQFADFQRHTPETLAQALQERTGLAISAETIARQDWVGSAAILASVNNGPRIASVEQPILREKISSQTTLPANQLPITPEQEIPPASVASAEIATKNEETGCQALLIQHAAFAPIERPAKPNHATMKFLQSEIDCSLIGAEAMTIAVPFCTQVHAVDKATGGYKLLVSQVEQWQPGQMDYQVRLEFAVPGLGRYQLFVIAFLLQADSSVALYQGPLLRVVT